MKQGGYAITAALLISGASLTVSMPSKPTRKALACDIHNFLVIKDSLSRSAGIRTILAQIATTLVSDLVLYPFRRSSERDPWAVLKSAASLLKQGGISGEGFYTVFSRNGYQDLAKNVLEISNAYNAPPGMAQLLDELKANNVLLFIASNIGSHFYRHLAIKNNDLRELFSHFDSNNPGITVQFVNANGAIAHHPIKKPDQAFFERVKRYAKDQGIKPENMYFGDDNEIYVAAAKKAGINGIHFNAQEYGERTAEALREEFVQAGLLKPQPGND